MGPYFLDKGSKPCPLHWEYGVLTTGPPGKSHDRSVLKMNNPKENQAEIKIGNPLKKKTVFFHSQFLKCKENQEDTMFYLSVNT